LRGAERCGNLGNSEFGIQNSEEGGSLPPRSIRDKDKLKIAFAIFLTLFYLTPTASGLTHPLKTPNNKKFRGKKRKIVDFSNPCDNKKKEKFMKFDKDLFFELHPDFFEQDYVKNMDSDEVFEEMVLELKDFFEDEVEIPIPKGITFGFWNKSVKDPIMQKAIKDVEEDWLEFFNEDSDEKIFCAFDGNKIASFCALGPFGTYKGLKIAGPGCVGTVPEYRRKGIGLKMVQKATQILKDQGYDISYIHWTTFVKWYGRLGYKTIVRWNREGIVENYELRMKN